MTLPLAFSLTENSIAVDKCIVYLDDAHTRGTDLKLPRDTRAAVTLGPKVTKDRLVQGVFVHSHKGVVLTFHPGCMRMRQLGHGQSVMFFAPPECDARIRAAAPTPLAPEDQVTTADILRWVLQETIDDICHYTPHFVRQNLDYARRSTADQAYEATGDVDQLRQAWLTPEARTLEEMYGALRGSSGDLADQACAVPALQERLKELGITSLEDPRVDEEQEREVSHEIER
jgi:hypothetical protein